MKLQPYLDFWVSETDMDFSCPACVLLLCLSVPLCPFSLYLVFLSLSLCCQNNQNRWRSFCSAFFSLLSLFTLRLPLPCFPYFGMSMCYLLTLCMNDNMSVYSYRELYPIPLVLTKKMV